MDIASYRIGNDHIEEIAPPAGNLRGGMTVNEHFSAILQKFVKDEEFSRYIGKGSPEKQAQHKADLNELIYTRFEKEKRRFGSGDNSKSYFLEFPHSFFKLYEDTLVLKSKGDMSVQVGKDGAVMQISNSKMAEIFQSTIDSITNLIIKYIHENNLGPHLDTIYWVGDFGGCKYLHCQLKTVIKRTFPDLKCHFSVPPEPHLAVIRGATTFRCHPSIVRKKKADATYGTGDFDAVLCCPNTNENNRAFHAFVKSGDDIDMNKVFVMNFTALEKEIAAFPLYATFQKDVRYTTDKNVHKLGEVSIDMGGYGLDREIELACDITSNEIHVRVRDRASRNEQKIVVDYLSSSKQLNKHLVIIIGIKASSSLLHCYGKHILDEWIIKLEHEQESCAQVPYSF